MHFCISLRQHDDMLPRSRRMRPTSPLNLRSAPPSASASATCARPRIRQQHRQRSRGRARRCLRPQCRWRPQGSRRQRQVPPWQHRQPPRPPRQQARPLAPLAVRSSPKQVLGYTCLDSHSGGPSLGREGRWDLRLCSACVNVGMAACAEMSNLLRRCRRSSCPMQTTTPEARSLPYGA